MKRLCVIILCLFILASLSAVCFAKTGTKDLFSPPLIQEITDVDLKRVEKYLSKSATIKLKSKDVDTKNRVRLLTILLDIYSRLDDKSNLARIFTRIRKLPQDAIKLDGTEDRLKTGLELAMLYKNAYSARKEKVFKDRAMELLKKIEMTYFNKTTNAFFVREGGKVVATATGNANASIVFLKISRDFKEMSFEDIARHSIKFLKDNLIKGGEAFHIFDPDTSRVYKDGQLIDNALVGIAMFEAYKVYNDIAYLGIAKDIAGFMQKRLYDEKLGGFILRSSNSLEYYPEGEELYIPDKPFEGNAFTAYLFESLYETTLNNIYGEITKGTLSYLLSLYKDTPPDRQFYFITTVYNYMKPLTVKVKKTDAIQLGWGTRLPDVGILSLALISFLAGILSFLSPCTLPILPAYFAFTFQGERGRILVMTFSFFLGLASVFSIMGATASFIGSFLKANISLITKIGGILIILFGFMSFIGKGFSGAKIFKTTPSATLGGSFIFGATMAFCWTACVGPILAGILILAATEERILRGIVLLFIYALGLGLPLMIISLFFEGMDKDGGFWRFLKGRRWEINIFGTNLFLHSTNMISGIMFISLGILMVTDYLAYINKILPLSAQVWFAGIEYRLLEMFK